MWDGRRNKNNLNFRLFMCGPQLGVCVVYCSTAAQRVGVKWGGGQQKIFLSSCSVNQQGPHSGLYSGQPVRLLALFLSVGRLWPRPWRHTETAPQSIDLAPWPNAAALFQCARPMALISGPVAAVVGVGRDSREAPQGVAVE